MRKPGAFGRPGFSELDDLANVDWHPDDTRDADAEQGDRHNRSQLDLSCDSPAARPAP